MGRLAVGGYQTAAASWKGGDHSGTLMAEHFVWDDAMPEVLLVPEPAPEHLL